MSEMKQAERLNAVRNAAIAMLNLPADAKLVKTGTFAFETEFGPVRVAITAVKDVDNFNITDEAEAFEFDLKDRENKALTRKIKADEKKAANIAKKVKQAEAKEAAEPKA